MTLPIYSQFTQNSACLTAKSAKTLGVFQQLMQRSREPSRPLGDAALTHNPFPFAGGGRRFTHFDHLLHLSTLQSHTVLSHLRQAAFPISSHVSRRTAYVQ